MGQMVSYDGQLVYDFNLGFCNKTLIDLFCSNFELVFYFQETRLRSIHIILCLKLSINRPVAFWTNVLLLLLIKKISQWFSTKYF